jgi:hypothetical protein
MSHESEQGDTSNKIYAVERLISRKLVNGHYYWRVRWAAPYTKKDDTWEPVECLNSALISEYNRKLAEQNARYREIRERKKAEKLKNKSRNGTIQTDSLLVGVPCSNKRKDQSIGSSNLQTSKKRKEAHSTSSSLMKRSKEKEPLNSLTSSSSKLSNNTSGITALKREKEGSNNNNNINININNNGKKKNITPSSSNIMFSQYKERNLPQRNKDQKIVSTEPNPDTDEENMGSLDLN